MATGSMMYPPTLRIEIPPLANQTEFTSDPATEAPRNSKSSSRKCCASSGCKKKLSLTDFPCKCGATHCAMHRAPEVHSCTYDFKAGHKDVLLKTMSTSIIAKKIDMV